MSDNHEQPEVERLAHQTEKERSLNNSTADFMQSSQVESYVIALQRMKTSFERFLPHDTRAVEARNCVTAALAALAEEPRTPGKDEDPEDSDAPADPYSEAEIAAWREEAAAASAEKSPGVDDAGNPLPPFSTMKLPE